MPVEAAALYARCVDVWARAVHGVRFAADLAPDVRLSNAPPLEAPNWAQALLPLERPVPVERGDEVRLALTCRANGSVLWRHAVPPTRRPLPSGI